MFSSTSQALKLSDVRLAGMKRRARMDTSACSTSSQRSPAAATAAAKLRPLAKRL